MCLLMCVCRILIKITYLLTYLKGMYVCIIIIINEND